MPIGVDPSPRPKPPRRQDQMILPRPSLPQRARQREDLSSLCTCRKCHRKRGWRGFLGMRLKANHSACCEHSAQLSPRPPLRHKFTIADLLPPRVSTRRGIAVSGIASQLRDERNKRYPIILTRCALPRTPLERAFSNPHLTNTNLERK